MNCNIRASPCGSTRAPNLYQLEDFFVDLDRAAMSAMSNRLDSLLLLRRVIRLSHFGKTEGDFLNVPAAAIARLDEVDVPPPAAAEMPVLKRAPAFADRRRTGWR